MNDKKELLDQEYISKFYIEKLSSYHLWAMGE